MKSRKEEAWRCGMNCARGVRARASRSPTQARMDGEHAHLLAGLLSFELPSAALGALACCSRALHEALPDRLCDVRQSTELELCETLRARGLKVPRGSIFSFHEDPAAASELRALLRLAAVRGIRELKLRSVCCGGQGMGAIVRAAQRGLLDKLEHLSLVKNFVDDRAVEQLAEHGLQQGGLRRLRVLNLSQNCIGERGLLALCAAATAGALQDLVCLRLAGNTGVCERIHRTLVAALEDGAFPSLRELVVPQGCERHAALVVACRRRRIKLV